MGAETDLSPPTPPVPEPTLSSDPDVRGHGDNQSWKADMMSALGESVSFGRFLSEPLDLGKWSTFAHNRYLEEAARQARPGSVAQKKAMFEKHYARKRKVEADDAGDEGSYEEELAAVEEAGGFVSLSSSAAGSSCMTDEAAPGQEVSGGGGEDLDGAVECGGGGDDGDDQAEVAVEKEEAVTDSVGSDCKMDGVADEIRDRECDVAQIQEKKDLRNGDFVPVDAVERQPLKESSFVNQDVTDSAKKRKLQKPSKLSSPSSGKEGRSSSAKRRSALHSSNENALPPSTDGSKGSATSVPIKRSTLAALHMSMSFSRCETGNAASSSRNLGTTFAERISQLQSASRPVENCQPVRPPTKVSCRTLPEIAPRTAHKDEQRSSHVMRVKEKLFGSTSQSLTKKIRMTREKEIKLNNEPRFKESRQSFCFKTRPLPNFCWKNKKAKDSNQQLIGRIRDEAGLFGMAPEFSSTLELYFIV